MNVGLNVSYLYHDSDIIEVRVRAENARFKASADVYVGTDCLLEAASALQGFPRDRSDKREIVFGAAGQKFAGGSVRVEFYCKDLAGHTALRAAIEDDYGEQELTQSAMVFVDFDPASLDQFLVELQEVEREHRGSASLIARAL